MSNIENNATLHGIPCRVDHLVVVVEDAVRVAGERVRYDVAGAQFFKKILELAHGPADVDHHRLVQLPPGFERPVESDHIVAANDGLGEPDFDSDDHVGVQLRRLNGLFAPRPPDVFEFADIVVELAHAGDMQIREDAGVHLVDHVAVEARDCG